MLKKRNKESDIINHIWYLLSITLLIAFTISGSITWLESRENKTNNKITYYHNHILHNIDVIHIELLNIKTHTSKQNISNSKYIINKAIENVSDAQSEYENNIFEATTTRLKNRINKLNHLLDREINNKQNPELISRIPSIILTIQQLSKLHEDEINLIKEKHSRDDALYLSIITATSILLILLYIAIVWITKNKIKNILKQQRDTENSLRNEKELIHITLNSIGDAVITTDNEGKVTLLNPIAEELTGWNNDDATGKHLNDILKIIDTKTKLEVENPAYKVIKSKQTVYLSNSTTLISKSGCEYQISDSAAPIISDDNSILGAVLVFNNVTEQYSLRKEFETSKLRLDAIMNNSPEIIYVNDINGKLTYINSRFEKTFNIKMNEAKGKSLHDLLPDESTQTIIDNQNLVLKTPKPHEFEEVLIVNNSKRTYASTKFPIYNELGTIDGTCTISSDITERVDREKHQRQTQKMEALGKLTGGIAHDYNNILGIITGYTDLLIEKLDDAPDLKKFAIEISRASDRGATLTKKLLSFTRKKQAKQSTININDILLEEKQLLEKTLTSRINLKMDLARDLWSVYLDNGDLEDAIINLCINSSHAIDGPGSIQIRTRNEHINPTDAAFIKVKPGDYVLLSITDTGCGMDHETQTNIFDPFFTTKGEKGTGLGLSQVYGFIERSKGAIQVYSEPDKGCQMVLYFPRHYHQNKPVDQHTNDLDTPAVHKGKTILIVDDETSLLSLTHEILSLHGYRALCAESASQALDILKQENIDLVISDIIMPQMDGYELAAIIQDKYPSIIIQLCSGFSDERNIGMVDRQLQNNILHKPFHTRTLLKRIDELLNQQK